MRAIDPLRLAPGQRPRRANRDPAARRAPRAMAGFTLLEMIVVILLLTILLGFAIPAFQGRGFSGSRANVARELLSAVQKAKIAALSRQTIHEMHIDLDERRIWVTQAGAARESAAPSRPPSPWTLPDDTRIALVRFPDKREVRGGEVIVAFYPQGYSDRALIRLRDGGRTDTDVIIEAFLPMALVASADDPRAF